MMERIMTVRDLLFELLENSKLDDKVTIEVKTRKDRSYSSADRNLVVFNWEGNVCIEEMH